jgi:photosystem II stability/assembly factor-like uncharacterized protein
MEVRMAGRLDRILYVGTWDGLYQAEPNGHGYKTRLLGLESPDTPNARWNDHRGGRSQGYGAIRCAVVVDKDDPRRLYAPTNREGMWLSEDSGETWREINRGLVYKEIWSLCQHPKTGELMVGTGPSAFFSSTDRGETWVEAAQLRTLPTTKHWTFPGPPFVSHIKDIGVCADDPSLVFGSIEEGGVVRSRDGGHTWDQIDESNGIYDDVHTVSVMPDDHRTLVSTTGKGVYRSGDGGDTWALSSDGLERWTYMSHLLVHPSRPRVLFTAAAGSPPPTWIQPEGANAGFFRSEDQGQTWQRLRGGLPDYLKAAPRCVVGDPQDPNAVFVGMTDGTAWMSEDGGESFQCIVEGLNQVTSIRVAHR